MNTMRKLTVASVAGFMATLAASANAQIVTTEVVAQIGLAAVAVGVIGGSVAGGPIVAKAAWKWVKGAIS